MHSAQRVCPQGHSPGRSWSVGQSAIAAAKATALWRPADTRTCTRGYNDPNGGLQGPDGLSTPVLAFVHADIKDEEDLRRGFKRVNVCRQYVPKPGPAW